jgi:hypothetical protein
MNDCPQIDVGIADAFSIGGRAKIQRAQGRPETVQKLLVAAEQAPTR